MIAKPHGVWLEDNGLRVRYRAHRGGTKTTKENFLPYYDIRDVKAVDRRSMSGGDEAALLIGWALAGFFFLVMVVGEIEMSVRSSPAPTFTVVVYLAGFFAILITAHLRSNRVLALDASGGHLVGLRKDAQGWLLLPLESDGQALRKDEVDKLAAKISTARQAFFERAMKESRSEPSTDPSPGSRAPYPAQPDSPSPVDTSIGRSGARMGRIREALPSRLELKEELGRGGMATVYLGRDRQLDREVAVKVLHESLMSDEEAVARFEREAKLIAGLEHPNLLGIYGVERVGEDRLGLVMPYVRGGTLRELIRSTEGVGLEPKTVTRISREMLKGLGFAHQRGVVHRDIKPGNIFIEEETGRVLIGDFGIARAAVGHTALTQTGTSMGTPNYMAPEQIDSVSEVDGRADIYAVGMLMWEMLTGEQPWAQESLFNVIFKQKTEHLETPSSRLGDVPAALLAAWRKASRKNPDDRWATAEEMLEALSESGGDGSRRVREEAEPLPERRHNTSGASSRSDEPPDLESELTWKWNG